MLFYLIFLHSIVAIPQLNLHYTNWVSENDHTLQHTCLRMILEFDEDFEKMDVTLYCMSELPSKFDVQKNVPYRNFTFARLFKEKITSNDLYRWLTPIDIIEDYQSYLNDLETSNSSTLANNIYYNCTIPRFGPLCQYELPYYKPEYSFLFEIILYSYYYHRYQSNNFTCYIHLQCNRGEYSACLDWSEICDRKIDCFNGGIDEEHCWQLELNECKEDEYRCRNGECIQQSFRGTGYKMSINSCTDGSDLYNTIDLDLVACDNSNMPSVKCEDTAFRERNRVFITDSIESIYLNTNNNNRCLSSFKCFIIFERIEYTNCSKICKPNDCKNIVMNICPDIIFFPNIPVLFGNIYFIYKKNELQNRTIINSNIPFYVCYNTTHYNGYFVNITKISIDNMACIKSDTFSSSSTSNFYTTKSLHIKLISELYGLLGNHYQSFNDLMEFCNRSNVYQCLKSSKCISIYRLMDTVIDCPEKDDENMIKISTNTNIMKQLPKTHFKCTETNTYIHKFLVNNAVCNCHENWIESCEDENWTRDNNNSSVPFYNTCNEHSDLSSRINGESVETECEQWPCINIYTRCNGILNCPNAIDENGCHAYRTSNCSSKHQLCVVPDTNEFICLPIEKVNDGQVNCLGATDEHTLCIKEFNQHYSKTKDFHCMNDNSQSCISAYYLCNGHSDCKYGDDEQFCTINQTRKQDQETCKSLNNFLSDIEYFLCPSYIRLTPYQFKHFTLHEISDFIPEKPKSIDSTMFSNAPIITVSNQHQPRCNRGLDLRIWLNDKNNSTRTTCLCSPHYYGDQCQYQNQRISLSVRFQALSDSWQKLFAIVISLIDDSDQKVIHSYEQFTYLPYIMCQRITRFYLLYSTRPKSILKKYAIHVDIYEKESLAYRGSLLYPIRFPFLPIHRPAFIVRIPPSTYNQTYNCSNDPCIHGECIKYYNNGENLTFCQCHRGWSGRYCNILYNCTCSPNSLCIGVSSNNRSICVCPLYKFGPRCLLNNLICGVDNDNSTCRNGGKCIPIIDNLGLDGKFQCICSKEYSGERCEIVNNNLTLSFDKNIILSESIYIHFFDVIVSTDDYSNSQDFEKPLRTTTFQRIPFKQDSITIYFSKPFHMVFIELTTKKTYYLTVLQKNFKQPQSINKTIHPSERCPNISELFNQTFLQWSLLRRMKYYHIPCQNLSLNLSCFHDDVHLCICYDFHQQRLSNCFRFEHNKTYNCEGNSECENNATCLQDDIRCPKKSLCICNDCFYGSRCQFSTSGFGLSLDAILGYHIIPQISLNEQSSIIKFSLALTIIFIIIGFINSSLCIITFKSKIVREVGCGLYLLISSIATLFTMIVFGLKFFILLHAQMAVISDRSFLKGQCHSIDFLLRVCLCTNQWLDACVATERAVTVIKATSFDKKTSKRVARFIIIIILVIIIISLIHDPIYRDLVDEQNDYDNVKRTWCIVRYPSGLKFYDYFIHSFHFFGPCLVNLISTIILITRKTRQQLFLHHKQTYEETLKKTIQEHKHLLTGPILLFVLALPRLILTFISKCMKSTNDVWIFLIGYFISFIPSMLTFLLFIMPSTLYTDELLKTITRYRVNIRRYLHISS